MIRMVVKHQNEYSKVVERYAAQLGVNEIQFSSPTFLGEEYFDEEKLFEIRKHIEKQVQRLVFIENVPWKMSYEIVYGLEGRDEQIDNYLNP